MKGCSNRLVTILACSLCSLVLQNCQPAPLKADSAAEAAVKIGVILPLSGDFARYGAIVRKGIESIPQGNIEYIYEDEGCNAAKAITAFKKLSSTQGINYFLGPCCGSPQTAVAPLIKAGRQLAMMGGAAPREVFAASGGRMFSTQHSLEQESAFNAAEAYRLGARKVVLVFFENDFSRTHEKAFRSHFKGQVLETLAYSSNDVSTLKAVALRIKKLNPDSLYVPDALPLMQGLLKELHTIGIGDKKVFSVYSAQSNDVLKAIGQYGEGLIYSYPDIGAKDALQHFPRLAAKILAEAVTGCKESVDCAISNLHSKYKFDQYGVLEGQLKLKTVKGGSFSWL